MKPLETRRCRSMSEPESRFRISPPSEVFDKPTLRSMASNSPSIGFLNCDFPLSYNGLGNRINTFGQEWNSRTKCCSAWQASVWHRVLLYIYIYIFSLLTQDFTWIKRDTEQLLRLIYAVMSRVRIFSSQTYHFLERAHLNTSSARCTKQLLGFCWNGQINQLLVTVL